MTMDHKQEAVVLAWPGRAATERPERRGETPQEQPSREAVFDIADFKAIAAFAGLRPPSPLGRR